MKRHIKQHLKKLKRQRKQQNHVASNRYWYSVYCLTEKLFIGVSYVTVLKEKGKFKVAYNQWTEGNCNWRTEKHKIDMSNKTEGQLILCPKCGGQVDFRMWLSSKRPEFIDVKEINIDQLSDTQKTGS